MIGGRRGALWSASRAALIGCIALGAAACVSPLSLDDAPCPCAAGYRCCAIENRCVADREVCPISLNCPVPPAAKPLFEIGAGNDTTPAPAFIALDAAGHLPLHYGGQGGYHIYMQVHLLGLDPVGLTLDRQVFDPADTQRQNPLRRVISGVSVYCEHDQSWILSGEDERLILCPSQKPGQAMAGRDLLLHVEATDGAGRKLTAERAIHPDCPVDDPRCATTATPGCAAP